MLISDWNSDLCSSDLPVACRYTPIDHEASINLELRRHQIGEHITLLDDFGQDDGGWKQSAGLDDLIEMRPHRAVAAAELHARSEEHTSEPQSLMRISYAVFCLKKKNQNQRMTEIKLN